MGVQHWIELGIRIEYHFHNLVTILTLDFLRPNFHDARGAVMNGATTIAAVRCPYCVLGDEFRAMTADNSDGRYICAKCGHLATPSDGKFLCLCVKCAALRTIRLRHGFGPSNQEVRYNNRVAY